MPTVSRSCDHRGRRLGTGRSCARLCSTNVLTTRCRLFPQISANPSRTAIPLELLPPRSAFKDFMAEGIGPETLTRLVRDVTVVHPARGLYQPYDTQVEATHALTETAVLVPKGVVFLTSTLQFHGLTLQMPSAVWMAIERTACRPEIDYPRIRFVRFTGPALTERIGRHRIRGCRGSHYRTRAHDCRLLPLPHKSRSRHSDDGATRRTSKSP